MIDAESARVSTHRTEPNGSTREIGEINEHLSLPEIRAHLEMLANTFPHLATFETIGQSVEGRPLEALRVSTGTAEKPAILVLGGQHAREWVAHSGTLCMTDRLVRRYGIDNTSTRLLDRVDYYVISIGNPDGYEYSWTTDRLWRKNRGAEGHGVDLNRNWDLAWGTNSSDDPESDNYHGTGPFSELETQAFAAYIQSIPRLRAFVDVHGVAQAIIYPYGHTEEQAINHAEYRALAEDMADATAEFGPALRRRPGSRRGRTALVRPWYRLGPRQP